MRDQKIKGFMRIVNAIKSPIFRLSQVSGKYGTGFDLSRTGERQITLELMSGTARAGNIIDSIVLDFNVNVESPSELSADGWVNHVAILLEKALFDKQKL